MALTTMVLKTGLDQSVTILVQSGGLSRPRVGLTSNEVNQGTGRFLPNQKVQRIFIYFSLSSK